MQNIISNFKEIHNFFEYTNVLVCGGLCDFVWINYSEINDIDLIINTSAILKKFNIKWPKVLIQNYGFNMKRRTSTKFIENFYQGKYLDTKIDLFLVKNISNLNRDIVELNNTPLGEKIIIDSIDQRVKLLKTHLSYKITEKTEPWEKQWIKFKQIKALKKLEIYNKKYSK